MKKYLILSTLFLIPGCGQKVNVRPEFTELKKRTVKATGSSIHMNIDACDNVIEVQDFENTITNGLSRNEAVSIALQNNPELQAEFQNLGIAKADLVQAGLYTNPNINSVFRFPTASQGPGTAQMNIEAVAAFRLSDLWQVPLAQNVAQDLLEIISLRILAMILDIVAQTKMVYDACVATELQLTNLKELLTATKELQEEIKYRQHYGYTADIDIDFIDAQVGKLESDLAQKESDVATNFIELKKLMGMTPSSDPIELYDGIDQTLPLPELSMLEDYAFANRPEIQIACTKIQQYKDTIRLERAKIVKEVDIGVAFKQDFDRPFRGWGPYASVQLPLFDINYAQIARAEFLLKQSEKELVAQKIRIHEEIRNHYVTVQALTKEITWYSNSVIPSQEKAIDYAYDYAHTMQLNMERAIETKVKYFQAYAQLIDKQYHALKEFAQLERAVGKNIEIEIA